MTIVVSVLAIAVLVTCLSWFVVAPLLFGFKPFTSPAQAARGERRLKSR